METAQAAAKKIADAQAKLEKIHKASKDIKLDDEDQEEVNTVTDQAAEKMIEASDRALEKISQDKEATVVLQAAIDNLYKTLESFEEE